MSVKSLKTQLAPIAPPFDEPKLPAPSSWDPDVWHSIQARDDQLVRDEVLHGYASRAFIYEFELAGKKVHGVSVVGARELAALYKGIQSRIVASVDKAGELFIFKQFEPLAIQAQIIPQLADQPDFYEVIIETRDIKTGASIQSRKKELKFERRSDKKGGGLYERQHYDVIAESKAFRNGLLSILRQEVVREFEARCLAAGDVKPFETMPQMRARLLKYAAANAIALDTKALSTLTFDQIDGLREAVKEGREPFLEALEALNIIAPKERDKPREEEEDKPGAGEQDEGEGKP
jgi:hypothetical protein